VESGLIEGEELVSQGAFSVDAAAQLEGKPSMMNQAEQILPTHEPQPVTHPTDLTQSSLHVSGNCGMCKKRIETAALSVDGVTNVSWDSKTKQMVYQYDAKKASPKKVQEAIAKVGHDAGTSKASTSVYKTLPECCLYRDGNTH